MSRSLFAVIIVLALAASGGASAAEGRIDLGPQAPVAGDSLVVVPVNAMASSGVMTANFEVEYSPSLLRLIAVRTLPSTSGFDLNYSIETAGRLSVDLRGEEPRFEPGPIVWLLFRSQASVDSVSTLTLRNATLNGIALPAVDSEQIELGAGQVVLQFPTDLVAGTGEMLQVPLLADDAAGILAMDMRVEYDPAVIQAIAVTRTPITQAFSVTANLNTPGVILISLFGTQPLSGAGSILDFDFNIVGSAGSSTPIDLVSAGINEGAIVPSLGDGFVTVCDALDFDEDGVSLCDGDCDDDNAGRFPGNTEIGCDGIDQDCDAGTPDIFDGDGDGFTCDLDCNDGNPDVNPLAEEVCDGIDNDCDFGVDNVPVPVQLVQLLGGGLTGPTLIWTDVAGATGYDILRGSLAALQGNAGDIGQAVDSCLADDLVDTFFDDPDPLPVGVGFWYIIRPANCGGNGSYESGGAGQQGLRDVEAETSPLACP